MDRYANGKQKQTQLRRHAGSKPTELHTCFQRVAARIVAGLEVDEVCSNQIVVLNGSAILLVVDKGHLHALGELIRALLNGFAQDSVIKDNAIGLALEDLLSVLNAGGDEEHVAGNAPSGNTALHTSLISFGLELLHHVADIRLMAGHVDIQGSRECMERGRAALQGVDRAFLKDLTDQIRGSCIPQLVVKNTVSLPYFSIWRGTSSRMNCCAPVIPESPVGSGAVTSTSSMPFSAQYFLRFS